MCTNSSSTRSIYILTDSYDLHDFYTILPYNALVKGSPTISIVLMYTIVISFMTRYFTWTQISLKLVWKKISSIYSNK
jgi:hypothetical protein